MVLLVREGFLCVIVYIAIAVAAFFFPAVHEATESAEHLIVS